MEKRMMIEIENIMTIINNKINTAVYQITTIKEILASMNVLKMFNFKG